MDQEWKVMELIVQFKLNGKSIGKPWKKWEDGTSYGPAPHSRERENLLWYLFSMSSI
jgi:hypothetical protein